MHAFYEKISDPKYNGATFFAVCRGKVQYSFYVASFPGRSPFLCFQFVINIIHTERKPTQTEWQQTEETWEPGYLVWIVDTTIWYV